MKKFSTALLLSAGLAAGAWAQALPGHKLSPQPRALPAPTPTAAGEDEAWPTAIALEALRQPAAAIVGTDVGTLMRAGQALRIAPALAPGRRLPVYRREARMALRVGSIEVRGADAAGKESHALVLRSSRELLAGDLVLAVDGE